MGDRVLAVAQSAQLGGAEHALLRVARRLPELGLEVELALPGDGPLADAVPDGIPVHRLNLGGIERGDWPRAALAMPAAQRLAKKVQPDLVWLNGVVSQRAAPGLWGRPLVPWIHELVDHPPRLWRSKRFWRWAQVVLASSAAGAERAAALGVPEERLRVVGAPVEDVAAAPRPDWAGNGPVVGFVGRVEPAKGLDDLAAALPDGALAVIVGPEADAAYAAALREQLGPRAVWLGEVGEAAALMPWFDVLALPSRGEGFGLAAAEALAAGTPAVVTSAGGMTEVVTDGRNGAVVEPGDPGALREALAETIARSEQLGAAGREDAVRFAAVRVATLVAEAFREALAR